jgi:L-arabinokinase
MSPVYGFVTTAHGYGHASRQMEVMRTLLARRPDARIAVLSAVPEAVFRDYLGPEPRVVIEPFRADVGIVQKDGLVMDHAATLRALEAAWSDPDRAEIALADRLAAHRPSVVIADIPPVAFGAARRLGMPSVGVGNFDWAWIYAYYARHDPAFETWRALAERWHAEASIAVHLTPGPPLTGFTRVVEGGLLARRLQTGVLDVRARLDISAADRTVLASFGGFGLSDAAARIPPIPGVTWILADPMEDLGRPDTRFARGIPYLGLLAACDAVLTKPGYGIVSEAAWNHTRVLYTDRGDFPEYPWLVSWLHDNVPCAHVSSTALGTPAMGEALRGLFAQVERWPDRAEGAEIVADVVEDLLR